MGQHFILSCIKYISLHQQKQSGGDLPFLVPFRSQYVSNPFLLYFLFPYPSPKIHFVSSPFFQDCSRRNVKIYSHHLSIRSILFIRTIRYVATKRNFHCRKSENWNRRIELFLMLQSFNFPKNWKGVCIPIMGISFSNIGTLRYLPTIQTVFGKMTRSECFFLHLLTAKPSLFTFDLLFLLD